MMISVKCVWTRTRPWILVAVVMMMVMEAIALSGPNVCMVKQKYNITKRIKYRAPMSVRTYEWCFSMPPRCSRWNTEMRDLTRLETEERTAEVAVCCPGYKMKEVSCVPICPNGKTGPGCSEDCQPNRWGPNCVNECKDCSEHGVCSPINGECVCQQGWQGESCENLLTTTTSTTPAEDLLTTSKAVTKPTTPSTTALTLITSSRSTVEMIVKTTPTTTTAAPTELQIETKTQRPLSNKKQLNVSTSTVSPTQPKTTISTYKIVTTSSENPTTLGTYTEATTKSNKGLSFVYNRTEVPVTTRKSTDSAVLIPPTTQLTTTASTPVSTVKLIPTTKTTTVTTTQMPKTTLSSTTVKELPTTTATTPKIDTTTRKTETTRISLTTLKFKPKEIWIRPAQKEPEHITAVMTDKGTERSSVDLVSVISIAGGVMMAVITVAVIIVMIERCKKPRYEDVRKINDIRMQVMIDNNDVPPPYVRSIFHTPLPDPPNSEKCHYQPISTLDRNLKQFMRPVVVQQISPVMLENFRGILECHYDHLPRRSHEFTDVPRRCHDFGSQQIRCSVTPSITISEQLNLQRASLTESAIEALKCEAKLDVIDTTTAESEPLYAEIPCWRPPSEHAVEIINMNGEAVTEL
ncbi:mucin-17-like isoform X2 [Ostrinia furnacalis]|uniref:mucin-17-like isoform X2 n=1 Tax=Ostrinia furnacalis TaxID=93504 RepID=UPI00103D3CD6|nr:mucin-17-like isoform X2 [Ostrinia furnacalis]